MPAPTVDDLDHALLMVMQKNGRALLARLAKDEVTLALETENLRLACHEYDVLIDRAPIDVLEVHRAGIAKLEVDHAA